MSTIHIGAVYLWQCCYPHPAQGFTWHIGPMRQKEQRMALEVTMSNEEKVAVTAVPKTAAGRPDVVEGEVLFTVMSGDCTIGDRIDAMSVWVHSGDTPGESVIHVSGDADLGAGVVLIEDMLTIHVTDALAAGFTLTADVPVLK